MTDDERFNREISAEFAARSDPLLDFQRFLQSNQLPFLYGVMGFSLTIPGAVDYHETRGRDLEVVVISGTSDTMPLGEAQRVHNYAFAFNAMMIWHLERWRLPQMLHEYDEMLEE